MSTDLSICPEGNMLFFDLTVMEHIEFFGLVSFNNNQYYLCILISL